jgi:hypothetical protein
MASLQYRNLTKIRIFQVIFILISLISITYQTPSCNSFPKIFGGKGGNSVLSVIDAFGDYLAMAGHTEDFSLSGLPNDVRDYPFALLASIAIPDYYYWAKVFSQLGFS